MNNFEGDTLDCTINISGVDKAHQACEWCSSHLADRNWGIDFPVFGRAEYTFRFRNSNEASTFALKWI